MLTAFTAPVLAREDQEPSGGAATATPADPSAAELALARAIQEYVNNAIARYQTDGLDATVAYYNSRASVDNELYLFLMDAADIYLVHPIFPQLIGTDVKDVVGSNGYELGKEIARATEEGHWVEYLWPNPVTGREEPKTSWVIRHDGLIFASGFYTPDPSAVVKRNIFTEPAATLAHNIPDLRVTVGGAEVDCDFLTHYETTGGLTRWGFATSEVIAERVGRLTQYYQRGIADCQERDGGWRLERRLVWDYVGGGVGGAPDLGTEPELVSEQPGLPLGPWGHRVSNLAVDGTFTGFLDFFNALGGLEAFGYPKTEARLDDAPGAVLSIEGADPGVIRQYFQAAVFEFRPDHAEPVQLRFLGDEARDVLYPFGSHQAFRSFRSAVPLRYGQTFVPERTSVRDVLVTLYHATNGADWTSNRNWLSNVPVGEWFGVTTDGDGRVIQLDLAMNHLSGELPAELGSLTDLERLRLFGNQLQGEIPAELGHLGNLTRLSFWANQFVGSIPVELGNLRSLERLSGGTNQLTGPIPAELGNLTNLIWLDFRFNQLSGPIPPELGNLTNLTRLVFWNNRVEGEIPPELGNLVNLAWLDLDQNRLTGEIPAELGNLVNLNWAYLRLNRLTGEIPPELGNLEHLTVLSLHDNELTGGIPAELGNLVNLEYLRINDNDLSGEIPSELGNLTNLRVLWLSGNEFTGCIPAGLADVRFSDADELGLPYCEVEEEAPADAA